MADIKTKLTAVSPAAFIKQLEDEQRRKDCREVVAMMEEVTGKPAKMWGTSIIGFGKYYYTYASGKEQEMLMTGFSPRKQNLTLYLGSGLEDKGLMAKLGKYKTQGGCLHIKKLDDVDRKVLRDLIAKSVAEMKKRYRTD